MADKEELEEEISESKVEKSSNSSKIIMIIAGVVLVFLLIVGGIIAMLLSGGEEEDPGMASTGTAQQAGGRAKKSSAKRATSYVTVGPIHELDKFVVNLITKRGKRYLRVKISLELDSENVLGELETKKVVLSDAIIDTLTSRTKQELSTSKGKNRLKDELMSRINASLVDGEVTNVFFTEFIIQ
jgi:flagellar FliL protein